MSYDVLFFIKNKSIIFTPEFGILSNLFYKIYLLSISDMSFVDTKLLLSLIPSKQARRQYSFCRHQVLN